MVCVRTNTSGTVHMANAPQIHLMAEVSSSLCKSEPDWGSDATGRSEWHKHETTKQGEHTGST